MLTAHQSRHILVIYEIYIVHSNYIYIYYTQVDQY